jgi:predicted SprT family Zn-dependent metalloprotease
LIDGSPIVQTVAMNDFLYFCPTCKAIYEIDRHHIRPPAEPICEGCQQQLPVADDGDWLTYRRTRPRFEQAQ